MISFTVYVHPEPQGSAKAFVIGGRARITSDNKKLKPFRSEVTRVALYTLNQKQIATPLAGKHIPVCLVLDYYFARPDSVPKKRTMPVVKPDIDKLQRATLDALTGVLFTDDAQVVGIQARKHYVVSSPEQLKITVYFDGEVDFRCAPMPSIPVPDPKAGDGF